jgi:hypothetical protein
MKKFLLAYVSSAVVLALVLFIHYLETLKGVLGSLYAELAWKMEVLTVLFMKPFFYLLILQTLLFFAGFGLVRFILKKRDQYVSKNILIGFIAVSALGGALFLGLFEPILATDYFEYGVRQELNRVFEMIGYARINVTVYGYLTLIAVLTWFFVRKESNIAHQKSATPVINDGELLDN